MLTQFITGSPLAESLVWKAALVSIKGLSILHVRFEVVTAVLMGFLVVLRHDTGSIYTTKLSKEKAAFIFRFVSFWGGSEEVPLKC